MLIERAQSRARRATRTREVHRAIGDTAFCLEVMSARPLKRLKLAAAPHHNIVRSTGGSYHDRIPLDDDFEVVKARTVSSGPNNIPIETTGSIFPSTWTFGNNWAPDDDLEYSLDPDDGWYDEVLEADVGDVMEEVPKKKKKRSEASVCVFFVVPCYFLTYSKARPHVHWLNNSRDLYLDEILRYEGRGDFISDERCPDCLSRGVGTPGKPEFRCGDCFLPDLTCRTCFIRRHRLNPFHAVEVSPPSSYNALCSNVFYAALGWDLVL